MSVTTMKAKAVIKHLRIAPRKIRLVIDTIREKPVKEALYRLASLNKKGARLAQEALKSAIANAKVLKMDEEKLFVSEIKADGGPTFKRFMSRSMGRADRIIKRTTHLTVVLREAEKKVNPIHPPQLVSTEEIKTKKGKKLAGSAGKTK